MSSKKCKRRRSPRMWRQIQKKQSKEIPKDGTAVETVRALKKRYGDHLAIGRRRQLKKQTQGDGGSRKKLAAAHTEKTRCAVPALCKGHGSQGAPNERTFGKRRQAQPECVSGIRDRDLEEQLCLRKDRTSCRIFRTTAELDIAKQIVGASTRLWKMNVRTLWWGRPPLKWKKESLTTA
jgi:hypothetical protein